MDSKSISHTKWKYNNLIYVSDREFYNLRNKEISVEDLGREQKYIPFLNSSHMKARRLWNDMYSRCYNEKSHKRFPEYMVVPFVIIG